MKRSDLIEYKGLFSCAEPMGIPGRIEIKEHGPVQLGGQILFFSRTGPEALKDYCFTHGWGYDAWPTSCHGDVDTLGGHFLFAFWSWYLGGLKFISKVIKTDCIVQFRKQGLKLFQELQCRISVCLEQQWTRPHKHCQQTSDSLVAEVFKLQLCNVSPLPLQQLSQQKNIHTVCSKMHGRRY